MFKSALSEELLDLKMLTLGIGEYDYYGHGHLHGSCDLAIELSDSVLRFWNDLRSTSLLTESHIHHLEVKRKICELDGDLESNLDCELPRDFDHGLEN